MIKMNIITNVKSLMEQGKKEAKEERSQLVLVMVMFKEG